jgi:hypothetical protein
MQSNKDNKGGKSHGNKKTHSKGTVSDKAAAKSTGRSNASPTGPMKHGEKRTSPR